MGEPNGLVQIHQVQMKVFVMSSRSPHLELLQLVAVVANYWAQGRVENTVFLCVEQIVSRGDEARQEKIPFSWEFPILRTSTLQRLHCRGEICPATLTALVGS